MILRSSVTRSRSRWPVRSASYSNEPPSPAALVQLFFVQTSFSKNQTTAWRSSSLMLARRSSVFICSSARICFTASVKTSWPKPNCKVVSPLESILPDTPLSAIDGMRRPPDRRCSKRAAHTSIVARSRKPIRLPEKLSAFGAVPPIARSAFGSLTTRHRSIRARNALRPLKPYFLPLSFTGSSESSILRSSANLAMRVVYSGVLVMAFLDRPASICWPNHAPNSASASSTLVDHSTHFGMSLSKSPRVARRNTSTAFFQFSRTGVLGDVAPSKSANTSPRPPNSWRRRERISLYQPA